MKTETRPCRDCDNYSERGCTYGFCDYFNSLELGKMLATYKPEDGTCFIEQPTEVVTR